VIDVFIAEHLNDSIGRKENTGDKSLIEALQPLISIHVCHDLLDYYSILQGTSRGLLAYRYIELLSVQNHSGFDGPKRGSHEHGDKTCSQRDQYSFHRVGLLRIVVVSLLPILIDKEEYTVGYGPRNHVDDDSSVQTVEALFSVYPLHCICYTLILRYRVVFRKIICYNLPVNFH
jgi:hypothetical protein